MNRQRVSMMKRISGVVFCIALLVNVACGQTRKSNNGTGGPHAPARVAVSTPKIDDDKLKAQAEEVNAAFIKGDFGKVADLTYQEVVHRVGGRAQMIAFLENGMKEMRAGGFDIVSVSVDAPKQVIKVEKQLLAVVPTTMRVKSPQGILVGRSFLIGVSENDGEKWTFVDGSAGIDKRKLQILFPLAADKLELPQESAPVPEATKP
ncbi:MAG: hypothetical protein WCD76_09700 [Pyrinomonadaceae bacterium]